MLIKTLCLVPSCPRPPPITFLCKSATDNLLYCFFQEFEIKSHTFIKLKYSFRSWHILWLLDFASNCATGVKAKLHFSRFSLKNCFEKCEILIKFVIWLYTDTVVACQDLV